MVLTIVFSADEIMKRVKEASSLYAERHRDEDGVNRFDDFVFDEEYMTLFERLFLTCRAEADQLCAAYLMERDEPPGRDYILQLCMPPHWTRNMASSLENKLGDFITDYFLWLWLRDKTEDAALFLQSAESERKSVKSILESRHGGGRPTRWI